MKKTIALDADGVLLDYNAAYRLAWKRAFSILPELKDEQAYWPLDRWNVERVTGARLEQFRTCFDEHFWSSIPATLNSVEACMKLSDAGYELVCVSAVQTQFQQARLTNLQNIGFPIEHVIATPHVTGSVSPKAEALLKLKPIAFVDDYLPYMRGVSDNIHKALILREPNGSPNTGEELSNVHSQHDDLASFTDWWLAQ